MSDVTEDQAEVLQGSDRPLAELSLEELRIELRKVMHRIAASGGVAEEPDMSRADRILKAGYHLGYGW
jgi:hypothetical protein